MYSLHSTTGNRYPAFLSQPGFSNSQMTESGANAARRFLCCPSVPACTGPLPLPIYFAGSTLTAIASR